MYQIQLKGSALEQGKAHGEELKKPIHELFKIRNELVQNIFKSIEPSKVEDLLSAQVEFLKRYPRSFDEFSGIAQGSGLSLNQMMCLNNYTDFRDFIHGDDLGGCSVLAIRNDHQTLSGQTWDMHASATPYILHIESLEPVRHHILTVTGGMALAGVNEHGLSVYINNMHCNETRIGIMWGALVKEMLMHQSAKEALNFLTKNLPCSGHNYLLCDSEVSINVETTGKRYEVTFESSDPGVTFHTNHYVGSLKETEVLEKQSKTTHARYEDLERYFDSRELSSMDYDQIIESIFKGKDAASVCIERPKDPTATMTCGGLVCDLKARKGQIYSGLYTDGDVHSIEW